MTPEQARAMVAPFYDVLNRPAGKDVAAAIEGCTKPDWRSHGSAGQSKGRAEFVGQVQGFGKLLPDLTWKIEEVLVAGDRVIVRSEASATPAGEFFGVPVTGRSFRVMAIDVHTVQDGKLAQVFHVEDWATALRQLKGG